MAGGPVTWPFASLPMFGFRVILADPPWAFENYSAAGEGRNANQHYPTLSAEQIAALPVGHLAQRDCALFLWVTDPLLDRGLDVLKAWGFRFVTVAFTWAKRTSTDAAWHLGTGYYTRANPEMCLLGLAGRMGLPKSRAVRQLIVEPVREHNRHGKIPAALVAIGLSAKTTMRLHAARKADPDFDRRCTELIAAARKKRAAIAKPAKPAKEINYGGRDAGTAARDKRLQGAVDWGVYDRILLDDQVQPGRRRGRRRR